jgi:hypothetical protein
VCPNESDFADVILTRDQLDFVEWAIGASLPTGFGQRNNLIFHFARLLRRKFPADTEERVLRHLAYRWWRRAEPNIRTKNFAETLRDFLWAWSNIRPDDSMGRIVELAGVDDFETGNRNTNEDRVARVLRGAARVWGPGPFFWAAVIWPRWLELAAQQPIGTFIEWSSWAFCAATS